MGLNRYCVQVPFYSPEFELHTRFASSNLTSKGKARDNLMRTGTEFISEISAAAIFTSFNFHIFRFSGKEEVMCIVCVCALLSRSLVTVSGQLATMQGVSPPRNDHATNQLAAK